MSSKTKLQVFLEDEIISRYEHDYLLLKDNPLNAESIAGGISEPIIVQRTKPEGYMILNGHHRWAAAVQTGMKSYGSKSWT